MFVLYAYPGSGIFILFLFLGQTRVGSGHWPRIWPSYFRFVYSVRIVLASFADRASGPLVYDDVQQS